MDPIELPGSVVYDNDFVPVKKLQTNKSISKSIASSSNSKPLVVKSRYENTFVEDVESTTLNFNERNGNIVKKSVDRRQEQNGIKENVKNDIVKPARQNANISKKEPSNNTSKSNTANNDSYLDEEIDKRLTIAAQISSKFNSEQSNANHESKKSNEIKPSVDDTAKQIKFTKFFDLMNLNLKEFIYTPAPQGLTIKCKITRDKNGLEGGIHPAYYMYYEKDKDKKNFILAARKKGLGPTASYIISADPVDIEKTSESFVGKLKSTSSNGFTIFDNGVNGENGLDGEIRRELAFVSYESTMGYRGPRKIVVLIPVIGENGIPVEIKPIADTQTLAKRYKSQKTKGLMCLENKTPIWNEETGSYALNFHGRVTKSSVKNFQIIHKDNPTENIMQFGKIGEHAFTCDYTYPMSAIQAFGIAISSFDL